MSTQSETQALQKAPNLLQDLSKIPPVALVYLAILAMIAADALPVWAGVLLIVSVFFVVGAMRREQELKEAKARAATYANCIGPIIVASIHPNETAFEVAKRAQEWRESLRLSGNEYAEIIPIIELPYSPMLTEYGHFTAGWSTYQREVGQRTQDENIKWYTGRCPRELKELFASAVLPPVQQPSAN